jgi:hypothetical protein
MLTKTDNLVYMGQVYSYTKMNTEYDAFLYFDPEKVEFVVIKGRESAIPPNVNGSESGPIPARKFVEDNPKWAEQVRKAILRKLYPTAK